MTTVQELPKLLTEKEALAKYGHLLEDNELRKARQQRILGYYKRRSRIFYREDELVAFIQGVVEAAYTPADPKAKAKEAGPKSATPRVASTSGMTPELEVAACDLLRRRMDSHRPWRKKPPNPNVGRRDGKG